MTPPKVEIIPSRPAVRRDAPTPLDLLVRITPPQPEVHFPRPAINLGLVLDHSGSMSGGNRIESAREAAIYAVGQLLPTDRLSVTIFDDEVETIVPNAPAADKAAIVARLKQVQPDGTTALYAGWKEGAAQVAGHRVKDGLNRVLLLSDGLANVGLADPAAIGVEVKAVTAQGVGTTTLGVGDDYNEDLMEAMARAGDGNYYYVESPRQLPDIFQTELRGLMSTIGRQVSLGIEPHNDVVVADVLNDLDRTEYGRLKLPNLIVGMPVEVLVRLTVPPLSSSVELCSVRLAWDAPGAAGRHELRIALALPAISAEAWRDLAPHAEVEERIALLTAGRLKRQATAALRAGDIETTMALLGTAEGVILGTPPTHATRSEAADISLIAADLKAGDHKKFSKRAMFQSFKRSRGGPST